MNSRHPSPRRVWKVGSKEQLLPHSRDPLDPVDPVENSETSIFDDPSVDFGHFACGASPGNASRRLRRQIEALGGTGRALGSPGTALGGSGIHFSNKYSFYINILSLEICCPCSKDILSYSEI